MHGARAASRGWEPRRGPHPGPAGPFRGAGALGRGSRTGAVLRACSLCPARVLAWALGWEPFAPQCPATSMWLSPNRDSVKVCPVNVNEHVGMTKGVEARAMLAEDLPREEVSRTSAGARPLTPMACYPQLVSRGLTAQCARQRRPKTGQKPGPTEQRTLCQAAGSRPKTRATRPLPASGFISSPASRPTPASPWQAEGLRACQASLQAPSRGSRLPPAALRLLGSVR